MVAIYLLDHKYVRDEVYYTIKKRIQLGFVII